MQRENISDQLDSLVEEIGYHETKKVRLENEIKEISESLEDDLVREGRINEKVSEIAGSTENLGQLKVEKDLLEKELNLLNQGLTDKKVAWENSLNEAHLGGYLTYVPLSFDEAVVE